MAAAQIAVAVIGVARLLVTHTPAVQRRVAQFLALLRRVPV